jgi:hypothetical protein
LFWRGEGGWEEEEEEEEGVACGCVVTEFWRIICVSVLASRFDLRWGAFTYVIMKSLIMGIGKARFVKYLDGETVIDLDS